MMTIVEEIRQFPIIDVAARLGIRVSQGNKAMCFGGHDKRTPSLSFLPAKNIWKCFGCDRKGDTISLVMSKLDCDFKEALEWFAREFRVNVRRDQSSMNYHRKGYPTKRNRVEITVPQTAAEPEQEFSPDPELYGWFMGRCALVSEREGVNYLEEHGIPLQVANRFGLRELRTPVRALRSLIEHWGGKRVFRSGLVWGYEGTPRSLIWKSYAVLFPFYMNGEVQFLQGRLFKGDRKYLNPRGIAKPLYNFERIKSLPIGSVVHICEGVPDTLAAEANGLPSVGVLGASSFRQEWVDHFVRYDVVLMPDGDRGGETFRRTISKIFQEKGKAIRTVRLPPGKDVADVLAHMRKTK